MFENEIKYSNFSNMESTIIPGQQIYHMQVRFCWIYAHLAGEPIGMAWL